MKLSLWIVLTFMGHVYIVRSTASVDANPALSVRVTNDLFILKGTAERFRYSPKTGYTIEILFTPLVTGTVHTTGGSRHKGANYHLNNETDEKCTSIDTLPAAVVTHHQKQVDPEPKVLATLDNSGVRPSAYLNQTHSDLLIAGSLQARPSPWLQLILFNYSSSSFGSYHLQILYTNNPADVNMSVWKSNELAFTTETSLPLQVPGLTMTTGKGTTIVCSYRQHDENTLQMAVLSGGQVLSTWGQEKELFCREGCVCHTRNVNASYFSLLAHCCLDDSVPVCAVNTSDLKCSVRLEKNGVRMLKSSEDEQKTNQNEQEISQSPKERSGDNKVEVDLVTHQRSGDRISAAKIAGIALGAVVSFLVICMLAVWLVEHKWRTQLYTLVERPGTNNDLVQIPWTDDHACRFRPKPQSSNTEINLSSAVKSDNDVGQPSPGDNVTSIPRGESKVEMPPDSESTKEETEPEQVHDSICRAITIRDGSIGCLDGGTQHTP